MEKKVVKKNKYYEYAREGLVKGFFWSIGVTFGLAFVSVVLVFFLSQFEAIPIIGRFVANIVEATNAALSVRAPITR